MALFQGNVYSRTLCLETQLTVILPQDVYEGTNLKVLYLLHGLSGNSLDWLRYTRIEQYARQKGYIVIMPEVQRSFYTDMAYGGAYFTYITEELPALCHKLLGIKPSPASTFIAGLSMGGYGALKSGLRHSSKYKAAASFSGVCDLSTRISQIHTTSNILPQKDIIAVLGQDCKLKKEDDLFTLTSDFYAASSSSSLPLFITCGTEDFLYEDNLRFKAHLEALQYPFTYLEWPGTHSWDFWDASILKALDYFDSLLSQYQETPPTV